MPKVGLRVDQLPVVEGQVVQQGLPRPQVLGDDLEVVLRSRRGRRAGELHELGRLLPGPQDLPRVAPRDNVGNGVARPTGVECLQQLPPGVVAFAYPDGVKVVGLDDPGEEGRVRPAHDREDPGRVPLHDLVGADVGRVLAGLGAEGHDVRLDPPEVPLKIVGAEDREEGRVAALARERGQQHDVHRVDVLDVAFDEEHFHQNARPGWPTTAPRAASPLVPATRAVGLSIPAGAPAAVRTLGLALMWASMGRRDLVKQRVCQRGDGSTTREIIECRGRETSGTARVPKNITPRCRWLPG